MDLPSFASMSMKLSQMSLLCNSWRIMTSTNWAKTLSENEKAVSLVELFIRLMYVKIN